MFAIVSSNKSFVFDIPNENAYLFTQTIFAKIITLNEKHVVLGCNILAIIMLMLHVVVMIVIVVLSWF